MLLVVLSDGVLVSRPRPSKRMEQVALVPFRTGCVRASLLRRHVLEIVSVAAVTVWALSLVERDAVLDQISRLLQS